MLLQKMFGRRSHPISAGTYVSPALMPRTPTDFIIAIGVGLLLLVLLWGVPAFIIGALTHSAAMSFLLFGLVVFAYSCVAVSKLALDEDGIRFIRLVGSPKFLSWDEIVSIIPVEGRGEVIVRGWLWPPFPPREPTASLTSMGHYRIEWRDGYCYFPPKDALQFEALSAKHFSDRRIRG